MKLKKILYILLLILMLPLTSCSTEESKYLKAIFKNYDGTTLYVDDDIEKGDYAYYHGSTPERTYVNDDKIYVFVGWDKSLDDEILNDTTFVAQYKLIDCYTVTFKDDDGTVLQVSKVPEGEDAKYKGPSLSKPDVMDGNYVFVYDFDGWDKSLKNIQSDLIVTAQYYSTRMSMDKYKIKKYFDNLGTSTVKTGPETTMTYSGGFELIHESSENGLDTRMVIETKFGDTKSLSSFSIFDGSTLKFNAKYYIYYSNHRFSNMEVYNISTNEYDLDGIQGDLVAALSVLAAKFAVNNATDYLESHGLPYIY